MNETSPAATPPPIQALDSRPKWPATIGIIGIVFGVGGSLQAVFQLFSFSMTKAQMASVMTEEGDAERIDAWLEKLSALSIPSSIILTILGLLLLTGSILLLKRKKVAPPLLMIWGAGKIIAGIAFAVLTRPLMKEQIALMTGDAGGTEMPGMEDMEGFIGIFMDIGFYIGLVWLCVFPVFLFIWFSRRKIKADVANFG